jgi:hypothetical protein
MDPSGGNAEGGGERSNWIGIVRAQEMLDIALC